jgi:hypothetical protein
MFSYKTAYSVWEYKESQFSLYFKFCIWNMKIYITAVFVFLLFKLGKIYSSRNLKMSLVSLNVYYFYVWLFSVYLW